MPRFNPETARIEYQIWWLIRETGGDCSLWELAQFTGASCSRVASIARAKGWADRYKGSRTSQASAVWIRNELEPDDYFGGVEGLVSW